MWHQLSNECHRESCGPCAQPEGNGGSKRCHTTNICYKYTCNYQGCTAFYTGESSKNLMTRNEWHQNKYKSKKESFLFQHQQEKHDGQPANFKMEVLKSFKDCLSRQAAEGIFISKTEGEILNSKSEFHQPPIVRVRREIARGLWLKKEWRKPSPFLKIIATLSLSFVTNGENFCGSFSFWQGAKPETLLSLLFWF